MSFPAFSRAIRIFFSYATTASSDKNLFKKLKVRLSNLKRGGLIDDPCDSESARRNNLEQSVEASINQADICVLLISPEFFDSEHCYNVEMRRVLERTKAGDARLIPVLLRPTELKGTPLEGYQPLPLDGKPVNQRASKDIEAVLLEVASEIGKAAEEHARLLATRSRSEIQIPLENIPYGHNRFFTDRRAILTTLHNYFISSQTSQQTCIQALNGMAGIGKTQIAVEYAYHYKPEYHARLWFKAASRDLLSDGILPLAELFSLTEQDLADEDHRFSAVKSWLQHHDKWLVILDDIEDFELIGQFIPTQSSGHVLLTTHSQATGHLAHAVPVEQMTSDDSALFLLRRAKIIGEQASLDEASEANVMQAISIVQEVDGLSLALDQAGAYIEETHCSLARYLTLYRRQGTKLLEKRGQLAPVHPGSVAATLSLAFKKVDQMHPDGLELLRLFAFLHPDVISEEMIEQGASALGGSLQKLAADPFALEDAIALLLKFSLIQRHPDAKMLSIHRVVQAILKEELTKRKRPLWAIRVLRLVNSLFPEPEFDNWLTCEQYFSQARHCAELITDFRLAQKEAPCLLRRLGSYCYQRAYYQEAEQYLTDALRLYEQSREPEHLDMARTLNNLALLYHKRGKYQDAEVRYQQALAIRESTWGEDHSEVAESLNNLAAFYKDLGRYQEAEALYQLVLTIDEHTLEPDHPDTAATLSSLAAVYDELGKHSQAEPLYQRAFSIEERTLGTNHPDRILSLNTLAKRYEDQGNYRQAEAFYLRALALQEQAVGPEHPDTAQSLNHLASIYEVQESYQEAEALYQRALGIYEKKLGSEHPHTAYVFNNLAYLFCQQGRYQEAEVLYQRALGIYEKKLGSEHPHTANALNNLGGLYHLMKKDELAESLLRRGLGIYEHVLGQEHPDISRSLNALAGLLIHQQRYEEAKPLYQRLLDIIQQEFAPEHPNVALAREQYAILLEHISAQRKP